MNGIPLKQAIALINLYCESAVTDFLDHHAIDSLIPLATALKKWANTNLNIRVPDVIESAPEFQFLQELLKTPEKLFKSKKINSKSDKRDILILLRYKINQIADAIILQHGLVNQVPAAQDAKLKGEEAFGDHTNHLASMSIHSTFYLSQRQAHIDSRNNDIIDRKRDGQILVFGLMAGITQTVYAIVKAVKSVKNLLFKAGKKLRSAFRLCGIFGGGAAGATFGGIKGAGIGASTGLFLAGPPGAAAGAVIGGIIGAFAVGGTGAGVGAVVTKFSAKAISSVKHRDANNPSNPSKYELTEAQRAYLITQGFDLDMMNQGMIAIRNAKSEIGFAKHTFFTDERWWKEQYNTLLGLFKDGEIYVPVKINRNIIYPLGRPLETESGLMSTASVGKHIPITGPKTNHLVNQPANETKFTEVKTGQPTVENAPPQADEKNHEEPQIYTPTLGSKQN